MENIYLAKDLLIHVGVTLICSLCCSQIFKTILNIAITKKADFKFILRLFFSDGDFPSSHTAVSVTAVIIVTPILWEAVTNAQNKSEVYCSVAIFSLYIIWALYIIRDALGIRMRVQEQAKVLKSFLTQSPTVSEALQCYWEELASHINIKAGHMPHEVIGGVILALIFGIGSNAIRYGNYIILIIDIIIAIIYFIISYLVLSNKEKIINYLKNRRKK